MPYLTLEVRQINDDIEPLFQVWIRAHIVVKMIDDPNVVQRKLIREPIGEVRALVPPQRWPIPADHDDNLSSAWEWYIEEYAIRQTPVTEIRAKHVRKAFFDWGKHNFKQLFNTEQSADYYYKTAETALSHEITVEVHAWNPTVLAWPWEGLVDGNREFLGQIMSFERRVPDLQAVEFREKNADQATPLNILLVTARGTNDVDYRLVGRELTAMTKITLLNPPTLENLRAALADPAKNWGVLHFDCHGGWGSVYGSREQGFVWLGDGKGELVPITGESLLEVFGPGTPPHIFMNACRSAKLEGVPGQRRQSVATVLLRHPNVRDVTAMAYNLSVDAVNLFLGYYYMGIADGLRTSVALQNGRLMMANEPYRTCIGGKVLLQDWMVPVIYLKSEMSFNPVHDRVYLKGGFKGRGRHAKKLRFIGRDELFLAIDNGRIYGKHVVYTLYGLTGQGKTAFLDEYIRWIRLTGDPTPIIHLDMKKVGSANEMLAATCLALGKKKNMAIPHLADLLNASRYLIIWDHMPAELGALEELLDLLTGRGAVVLTAGRVPLAYKNAFPLAIAGLEEGHRWQFISELMKYRRGTRFEPPEQNTDLIELISLCQGHPTTMISLFTEYEAGITTNNLIELLNTGDHKLVDERSLQSFAILQSLELRGLLDFLTLCDQAFNRPLLSGMMKSKYGDSGQLQLERSIKTLQEAGLLDQEGSLHPLFPGINRNCSQGTNLEKDIPHLLAAIHSLVEEDVSALPLNVLERALNAAQDTDRELAIGLHPYLVRYYLTQPQWTQLEKLDKLTFELLTATHDHRRLGAFFLSVCERAVDWRRGPYLAAWLDMGKNMTAVFPADLKNELELEFLYGTAKLMQMAYRLDEFEAILIQIENRLLPDSDSRLVDLIRFEYAQLAALKCDWPLSEQLIMLLTDTSLTAKSTYYRLLGEIMIGLGNNEEARFALKRALMLSRKEGNMLSSGMITHFLGELETTVGDFQKGKKHMNEAALIFEAAGDRVSAGVSYQQLATFYYERGLFEEASDLFINSAICFKDAGDSGRLEVVADNYNFLKKELNAEGKIYLEMKWQVNGLS